MAKEKVYTVNNNSTNGKTLALFVDNGNYRITYDGIQLQWVSKGQYLYVTDESSHSVAVSGNRLVGITVCMLGNRIEVLRPLAWYEWVILAVTFLPAIKYGAIGGAVGAVITYCNVLLMRKVGNVIGRIFVGLGMAVLALISALLVSSLLGIALGVTASI